VVYWTNWMPYTISC